VYFNWLIHAQMVGFVISSALSWTGPGLGIILHRVQQMFCSDATGFSRVAYLLIIFLRSDCQ
jgi:hypothetical protein